MLHPRTFVGIALLVTACFEAPPTLPDTTGTTTEGPDDAIDRCRTCQADKCPNYAAACNADGACDNCIDAPITLTCLMSALFRPLADCSCENCAIECSYVCPGGERECSRCFLGTCHAERMACVDEPACAACIQDPYFEECAMSPTYPPLEACVCADCGPSCVWRCEEAAGDCTACLSGSCDAAFQACFADSTCTACFANTSTPGCAENELLTALATCTCEQCSALCGPLFDCA